MIDQAVSKFFHMNHQELVKEYPDNMTLKRSKYLAIFEGQQTGFFGSEDYIVKFSPNGDVLVFVERAWRENYNIFAWIALKFKAFKFKLARNHSDDSRVCVSYGKGTIDLIVYKTQWFDWMRGKLVT